jgi:hypothetical protein
MGGSLRTGQRGHIHVEDEGALFAFESPTNSRPVWCSVSGSNPADVPADVRLVPRSGTGEGLAMVDVQARTKCGRGVQAVLRRTSQAVTAMSSTDNAISHPPSINWSGQKWLAGW